MTTIAFFEGLGFGILLTLLGSIWYLFRSKRKASKNQTMLPRCVEGKLYIYENGIIKCICHCPNYKGKI
jgi:hypothetical protein